MHAIMYAVFFLIMLIAVFGGYSSGLYDASFAVFKNVLAFILGFTFFQPLTGMATALAPRLEIYPGPEYLRAIFFTAVVVIFISVCDRLKFLYLFPGIEITTGKYPDRIGGGLLGVMNGIVIFGIILVLWAMLPFVKFIPGDFGRVHTARLPVDAGELLLRSYARAGGKMGGERFYLAEFPAEEAEPDVADTNVPQRGWLWFYRRHADFTLHDIDRIMDDVTIVFEEE